MQQHTENYYPFSYLTGAGAYAVSPEGAEILVEDARNGIAFATDNFIRRGIVHIVDYQPSPTHQLYTFSSIQTATPYKDAATAWEKYQSSNTP